MVVQTGIDRLPRPPWTFEGYFGVWLFTANDAFYPGSSERTQDPITATQAHVSYETERHFWAAFDATWYRGGSSALNGVPKNDLASNTRVGLTVSLPIGRRHSAKLSYSTGATTRLGTDFDTIGVSWQAVVF